MIGPDDVIKAATNLQSHATSNVANVSQRAALAALTGDLVGRGRDARRVRAPRAAHAQAAHRHRGRHRARAAGRVLRLPEPVGLPRPADPRPHRRRPRSSCASCSSTRPRWPSSRARRSTRPATPGSATPSATTTSARAAAASPTSSPRPGDRTARSCPYGSWPTPITSELVVRSARLPERGAARRRRRLVVGVRPEEGGRTAVLRRGRRRRGRRGAAAPWNARTGVHEYGGGAWWVRDGVLWFVDWATQRLHRLAPGGEPEPLTPEPEVPPRPALRRRRRVARTARTLLCVREEHRADGAVARTRSCGSTPTSRRDARGGGGGARLRGRPALAARRRRVLLARVGPPRHAVGRRPPRGRRGRRAHGGGRRRPARVDLPADLGAPTARCGSARDRTGFWSLYRWTPAGGVELVLDLEQRHRLPAVGVRPVAASPSSTTAGSRFVHQRRRPRPPGGPRGRRHGPRRSTSAPTVDRLAARRTATGVVLDRGRRRRSSRTSPGRADRRWPTAARRRCVVPPRDLGLDAGWCRRARADRLPDRRRRRRPTRSATRRPTRTSSGPAGERPPLLVLIHGGPTAAARPMLQLSHASTGRAAGFAVVDVNYRGSTGLRPGLPRPAAGAVGRRRRRGLRGGGAAPRRPRASSTPTGCCIRGGSAGGFTTLAALAFHDVFAAGASHYGVADLGAAGRGHPQVRGPLPRRAGRPVAGGRRPPTTRARRSTTSRASTARSRCSRASTTRSCRPTRPS